MREFDNLKMPLISVIVPVYKAEKYLNKCVDSIINQTYENLEIILIDDGSPDRCPEICDDYAKKDSRVKVIHKENGGVSAARNIALDIMQGDVVAFVDSDDWLELNAYQKLIEFMMEENLDVVFMAANRIKNNEIQKIDFCYYPHKTIVPSKVVFSKVLRDEIGGQLWLKIYKKEIWNDIRLPVGRIYEDLAISHNLFCAVKGNIGFFSKPLYNYYPNDEGISLSVNPEKAYHIYWAMKEHYDFAKMFSHSDKGVCLSKTVIAGLSVIHITYEDKSAKLEKYADEVKKFLKDNKKEILQCNFGLKRKVLIRLFYFSNKLYKILGSLYSKIRK